jgi:tripartite-type tricarboxylate transporter receptor subunit TctC
MSAGPNAVEQIRAGKVRALAASTPKRSVVLPETPTFSELGFPDIALSAWFGILARTGTPAAITTRTSAEIRKVLSKPEVRDKLLKAAVEPVGNTPEEFAVFMKTDFERWGEAAKAAGISANAPSKGP